MGRMRRGVGYCEDETCSEFIRGVFLLNYQGEFQCSACGAPGVVERERGWTQGDSQRFKEVRIEYGFDPLDAVYREVAIVRDVSLWGRANVYTLQTPLIRTEKRALKVAEAILANLNRSPEAALRGEIPSTSEVVLSLDQPIEDFRHQLERLALEWQNSGLRPQSL